MAQAGQKSWPSVFQKCMQSSIKLDALLGTVTLSFKLIPWKTVCAPGTTCN